MIFQPTGLHHLIRQNMHEYTDDWELPLDNIPWIRQECEFFERLENTQTDISRLEILEKILVKRLFQMPIRKNIDADIVDYIMHKQGNLCIVEASRYFRTSVRTLERHFNHTWASVPNNMQI